MLCINLRRLCDVLCQVEVDRLSEDFSVEDEAEEGEEVPWIHFEQDVVNLHSAGGQHSAVVRT